MNILRIASLAFLLAALGAIAFCVFTDWNDGLYLPLSLTLSAVGHILNILCSKIENREREHAK